jgi:hypothetical protein
MTDLYLKTTTEAEMDEALLGVGILVDVDGDFWPAVGVSIDVIGPFTRVDYSVEPPVETYYPDWHVNVRSYDLTEDQIDDLTLITIAPPETPYRVWA